MSNLNHKAMFTHPKTDAKHGCIGKPIIIRERTEKSIVLTRHTIKDVHIQDYFVVGKAGKLEKWFRIKFTLDGGCTLYVSPNWQTYERNGEKNSNISVFAATDDLRNDFIAIANFNMLDIQCSLPYEGLAAAGCFFWDDETNSVKRRRHHIMPSADYYELGSDFKLKLRPLEISYGKGEYATAEECEAANAPDKYEFITTMFEWRGELGLSDDDLKSIVNEIL